MPKKYPPPTTPDSVASFKEVFDAQCLAIAASCSRFFPWFAVTCGLIGLISFIFFHQFSFLSTVSVGFMLYIGEYKDHRSRILTVLGALLGLASYTFFLQ